LAGEKIPVFNNGEHSRDFTYIDDIVDGVVRVLDRPAQSNPVWSGANPDPGSSDAPWRVYNIGHNSPVNLMNYIAAIEKAVGKKALLELLPLQPGDMPESYADISDLANHFQYKPATSIDEGVSKFVSWYQDFFNERK
jgi:UDP-glucuronate 4-epimerase